MVATHNEHINTSAPPPVRTQLGLFPWGDLEDDTLPLGLSTKNDL